MHTEMSPPIGEALDSVSHERSLEELEAAIAQIWQVVFNREHIGREQNFFELGGNSLLGMDLTELLASRLDIHIPVLELFRHPTIREIAAIVTADGERL